MTPPYIKKTKNSFLLSIRVEPRSSKSEIVGLHGEKLKIKIKAPPVDNKANKEVIALLADTLKIKKADISIAFGKNSKDKIVEIIADIIESRILDLSLWKSISPKD